MKVNFAEMSLVFIIPLCKTKQVLSSGNSFGDSFSDSGLDLKNPYVVVGENGQKLLCGFHLSTPFFQRSDLFLLLSSGDLSCARMGLPVARRSTGHISAVHASELHSLVPHS